MQSLGLPLDATQGQELTYSASTWQNSPRFPIPFGPATKIYQEFKARNTPEMATLPSFRYEIIQTLFQTQWPCVDFTQEEHNSYPLRELITAKYFKVQTPLPLEAWIHPGDKYIQPTDLYDPNVSDDENLGKQYFYSVPLHRDQRTNKQAKSYMKLEKGRFEARMQRVYNEHQLQTKVLEEDSLDVLFQQWAENVRKDFESLINRIVQEVNRLFEALRSL